MQNHYLAWKENEVIMSNINEIWNQPYAISEAEDGKFIPLDTSSLSSLGYPSSGEGKFAILTYNVNPDNTIISGAVIQIDTLSVNTTIESPITLSTNSMSTINFSPTVKLLEIFNNDSNNTVYVGFNTYTSLSSLSAIGLPIKAQTLYSIERITPNVTIGSINGANVRVFGHYNV
jgi:hypothetical protein